MRAKRNPKAWKVALGIVAGVVVGGAAGYAIARSRLGKKAIDTVDQTGLRLPDPSFAMELPVSEDQFALLDELVCECGEPVIAKATDQTELDVVVSEITDCVMHELYPQFPWPTVPGDHPTVGQLQTEVGVLARRAVVSAEICPPKA